MQKLAFQALKRMFMLVSGLPLPYFGFLKPIYKVFGFFKQTMLGEDLRHAKRALQTLKRTLMHFSGLRLSYFDF